jgi:hypothetical protein
MLSCMGAEDDYFSGEYLQDIAESALLELGGQQLLDQAHDAAGAFVDQHHPWHGDGAEPEERVSAYLAILWQHVERAGG